MLALVRNQSGIVDNYDLRVEGLPEDWYSIFPSTVYLVPFGSGGTYEQEVEIHLHPPRTPEAEAKMWDLRVVAHSKAHGHRRRAAPLALHIAPYIETTTALRPQRKKGRRKADFDVTVPNKANAPVLVALEGADPDGELLFALQPPAAGDPGRRRRSGPRCACARRSRSGSGAPQERRLQVITITGDEAQERAAAEPLAADVLIQEHGWRRKGLLRRKVPNVPGVYAPRIYKPQVYPPDVQIGPGGIQIRKPQLQSRSVQGPQLGRCSASQLKLPGRGGRRPRRRRRCCRRRACSGRRRASRGGSSADPAAGAAAAAALQELAPGAT